MFLRASSIGHSIVLFLKIDLENDTIVSKLTGIGAVMGLEKVKELKSVEEVSETSEIVQKPKKKLFSKGPKKEPKVKVEKTKEDKPKKELKFFRKRPKEQVVRPVRQNRRLDALVNTNEVVEFSNRKEMRDFVSTIKLMPIKGIMMNTRQQPLLMANGYAKYMQIMEIRGKDLYRISPNELKRTIANFEMWLNQMNGDLTFETTKLPTDTSEQVIEINRLRHEVMLEQNETNKTQRELYQLQERQRLLDNQLVAEEAVEAELYNTEYLLFLFDDTLDGLQRQVYRAMTSGNNDFVPKLISAEKKAQIYKQYNNPNEKV